MQVFCNPIKTIYGIALTIEDDLLAINYENHSISCYSTSGKKMNEFKLSARYLESLRFDAKNNLIVTHQEGVIKLKRNGKTYEQVQASKDYPFVCPHSLCFDENDDIYVSNYKKLFKLNSQLDISIVHENLFEDIWGIAYNKEKKLLFVCDAHKGIFTVSSDGSKSLFFYFKCALSLVLDRTGTLFAASQTEIVSIDEKGNTIRICKLRDLVRAMAFNSKGDLFFSCEDGKIYVIQGSKLSSLRINKTGNNKERNKRKHEEDEKATLSSEGILTID